MGIRILIVDDDAATLSVLARVFSREGHSVDRCDKPRDALEKLDRMSYDVLLTDFVMPGMSGVELVEAARIRRPDLRCVVMSGHLPSTDIRGVLWIEKPFDIPMLLRAISP